MPLQTMKEKNLALQNLEKRRKEASKTKQVDNSSLPAGSAMFYYCRLCNLFIEKLPENHGGSPQRYCNECQELIDAGWNGEKFIEYIFVTCKHCGGTGKSPYIDYYLQRPRTCYDCGGKGTIKKEKE